MIKTYIIRFILSDIPIVKDKLDYFSTKKQLFFKAENVIGHSVSVQLRARNYSHSTSQKEIIFAKLVNDLLRLEHSKKLKT